MAVVQQFDLSLNINKNSSPERIIVTANDNVEILITLKEGRNNFPLLPEYTYKLVSKPKNKPVTIKDLEVRDGEIVAPLNHSETGYQLPVECIVQVFDDEGNRITSTKFDVVVLSDLTTGSNVSPSGNATFTIVNEEEFLKVTNAMKDVEDNLVVTTQQIQTISNKIVGTDSKVFVEQFGRLEGETDDTKRVQRACDFASEYSTVEFDPNTTYYLSSVVNEKSLNLNLNGAKFIVDPTVQLDSNNNKVKGNPVFYFKGNVGDEYDLSEMTGVSSEISLVTIGDLSNFSKGDHIIISDSTLIPKWNGGTGSVGYSEINIIKEIKDGKIVLAKPTEWDYKTIPKIKKISPLKSPKIYGATEIKELHPGAEYSTSVSGGLTGYAPHIIHFQYCLSPIVSECHVDEFQLHVVNFHYCVFPLLEKSSGKNPFYPGNGGCGYFMRFENCFGGTVRKCYGEKLRHLVDFVMSYDCLSDDNMSVDNYHPAIYWHGGSSKRCNSINDKVYSSGAGWQIGNNSFSGDFDTLISNPIYKGSGVPLSFITGSKNLEVSNPQFYTSGVDGVLVSSGAGELTVNGGIIDILGNANNSRRSIMVRPQLSYNDTTGVKTGNVLFNGTKIRGVGHIHLRDNFSFTFINPDIEIINEAVNVFSQQSFWSGNGVPEKFVVKGGEIKGVYNQAFAITSIPTKKYEVSNVYVEGFKGKANNMIGSENLRFTNNDFINTNNVPQVFGFYGTNASLGKFESNRPPTSYEQT